MKFFPVSLFSGLLFRITFSKIICGFLALQLMIPSGLSAKADTTKSTIQGKTFIPGLVQLNNKETTKAYSIMGGEAATLFSSIIFGISSNSEYNTYKNLPFGTLKSEFDSHYNKSNLYGTLSIVSLTATVGIYLYSVADALWFSKPPKKAVTHQKYRKKIKKYSLDLEPKNSGIDLAVSMNF